MAKTVGDFLVERLRAWGVQRVFGYPGDGINGIMGAFEHAGRRRSEFIQARHEEMAAFMACAHAKFTGEVGVCLATSGPGAIHLLNGLYDAEDGPPAGGRHRRPVGDAPRWAATTSRKSTCSTLFKDVAHEYVHTRHRPGRRCGTLIDRAFRIARSSARVTCVIVPKDVQEMDAVEMPPHASTAPSTPASATSAPRVVPSDDDLERAAEVLNAGERVAMLVGAGALRAADEVIAGGRRARRRRRQGAARQGRAARRPARSSPAPSACSAPSRAGR